MDRTSHTSPSSFQTAGDFVPLLSQCLGFWVYIARQVREFLSSFSKGKANLNAVRALLHTYDCATRTLLHIQDTIMMEFLILFVKPVACIANRIPRSSSPRTPARKRQTRKSDTPAASFVAPDTTSPAQPIQPDSPDPQLQLLAQAILARCAAGRRQLERFANQHDLAPLVPDESYSLDTDCQEPAGANPDPILERPCQPSPPAPAGSAVSLPQVGYLVSLLHPSEPIAESPEARELERRQLAAPRSVPDRDTERILREINSSPQTTFSSSPP